MPRDLVDTLCRTGLFSLSLPRVIGGAEATPTDLMRLIEMIAAADGSTGWCAMVGIGNNVAGGYMDGAGAMEVFADTTRPTAGIAAPAGGAVRVDGGVRSAGGGLSRAASRIATGSGPDAWSWRMATRG